ncbi:GLPGLI family protein [Spirosoma sp. BT702]|uniref:GLPGLI family protein n=1 Tax=Spirosoma profusum TaxID=2771354 RepID=A0A927GAJ8_9BACT|nr:GLPGLI family protein [Spirosoma profusum]MBD2705488.1 GLPGLI family protein [Spirosoma profusum]
MKLNSLTSIYLFVSWIILCPQSFAQSPVAGQITYEGIRKFDPSGMRVVIGGEEVKPGDPNFPAELPDARAFSLNVLFNDQYLKEEGGQQSTGLRTMVSRPFPGGPGGPPPRNPGRPFDEQTYIDLSRQYVITLLTIGKDKEARTYRAEVAIPRRNDWHLTDQTKRVAGYTCRKATITYRNETYTAWITDELPFTYSPIRELTPNAGVILLVEGSREQFRATKVSPASGSANEVQPPAQAELISIQKLNDLREKAIADFQQQLMMDRRN